MRRGFSLAELMVALLVIGLAVLGLVSVQIYVLRAQAKSGERNTASVLAASRMNQVEASLLQDFDRPVAAARAAVYSHDGFEIAVGETGVPDLKDLREVSVSVYWTDANGPQEHSLWTRFLRP